MAPFPQTQRTRYFRSQLPLSAWWPWLALGFFIMACFGLATDSARDVRHLGNGVLSAENTSEGTHLSKRDPARLASAGDRRDGKPFPSQDPIGDRIAHIPLPAFPEHETKSVPSRVASRATDTMQFAFRSRAPPPSA